MSADDLHRKSNWPDDSTRFRYGLVCSLESLTPDKPAVFQGPFDLYAQEIADIGYDAVELHLREPARYDPLQLKKTATDAGITFAALSTGMEYSLNKLSLISDDALTRQNTIDRLKEHIDLAAELGCLVVIGTLRDNITDLSKKVYYENYLTEALLALSDYAAPLGVDLAVESITRYINNYLNSVPETVKYISSLKRENVKLHIDTHSMNIEDPDLPSAVLSSQPVLGYVHFSDSNRCFPGAGNIDFKPILHALQSVFYRGYIVSECLPWPDAAASARLGLHYMKALETCASIEAYRDANRGV